MLQDVYDEEKYLEEQSEKRKSVDDIKAEIDMLKFDDSAKAQSLVEKLQSHITENYYNCTNEILSGLGKMYVCDERFKNNIDKHGKGTSRFVCDAIDAFVQGNI